MLFVRESAMQMGTASSILATLALTVTSSSAMACNMHDILVGDVAAINQSNEMRLAFVLTATESNTMPPRKMVLVAADTRFLRSH